MLDLRHGTSTCPQCDGEVDHRAVWCGRCGAALPDPSPPVTADATVEVSAPAGPRPPRRSPRRLIVLGVLLALVVGVVIARPPAQDASLVGRLDVGAGPSATTAPPVGLDIAWHQRLGTARDVAGPRFGLGHLVVRDGRVAVGGALVDLATGVVLTDLLGAPPHVVWNDHGEAALLSGDRLVVVDVLTGGILHRRRLDVSSLVAPTRQLLSPASVRGSHTSLFVSVPRAVYWGDSPVAGWILVDDDGEVVARAVGAPGFWEAPAANRAVTSSTGFVLLLSGWDPDDAVRGDWVVVDLGTGDEALRVERAGWTSQPPQIVEDVALVVDLQPASDGPVGSPPTWDVVLHDLRTREVQWRTTLQADGPPQLHARTASGAVVLAVRDDFETRVLLVDGDGVATTVATEPAHPDDTRESGLTERTMVAADHELAVVLNPSADELAATGLDGTPRWRTPVSPLPDGASVELAIADDLVALGVDDGRQLLVHLVDRVSGAVVRRVAPGHRRPTPRPANAVAATIAGVVAVRFVGTDAWVASPGLGGTAWYDVRTGRARDLATVAAGWGGDDQPGSQGLVRARLSGTVLGDDGRVRPVVVWPEDGGRIELLVGRDGPTSVLLPSEVVGRAANAAWGVVAVTGDTVVLHAEDVDGVPIGVLLDRVTGATTSLDGVRPVAVAGPVVIGQREALDAASALVALHRTSGDLLWSAPWTWGDHVIADDRQVVTVAGADVIARRPDDGSVEWRSELDRLAVGSVVLTERTVVLPTVHREVLALDRDDGTVVWRRRLDGTPTALAAAGHDVVVGTADGLVVHLDATGRELQRVDVGPTPVLGVAPLGETVVVTLADAVLGLRSDVTGISPRDQVDLP